jgi:uncharacterized membrane protein
MKYLTVLAFAVAGALAACSSPTGSTCPAGSTLGYANGSAGTDGNFGKDFFGTYCTSCHSATSTNRNGAPGDQNFDTEAEIIEHASDIDSEAAAGPDATNTDMPELDSAVPMAPTTAERTKLGQFLACETAK